jgi:hypothetical protein
MVVVATVAAAAAAAAEGAATALINLRVLSDAGLSVVNAFCEAAWLRQRSGSKILSRTEMLAICFTGSKASSPHLDGYAVYEERRSGPVLGLPVRLVCLLIPRPSSTMALARPKCRRVAHAASILDYSILSGTRP